MFRFVSFVIKGQPHNAAQRNQSDATHGDPCERRRPRPRVSSSLSHQQLKDQKVSHCRLGRFAMEMCRSGRFGAVDLSARVSAGPTSEPTLRRLASGMDVGTRVRMVKREQHHKLTAKNSTSAFAKWCNAPPLFPQASQCGAKSRTARHLRTFPFCCITKCFNTQSLKAWNMTGLRPTPRKWASRTVYVSGAHISEWTQHKDTGRACLFGVTARRSLRKLQIPFSFSRGGS